VKATARAGFVNQELQKNFRNFLLKSQAFNIFWYFLCLYSYFCSLLFHKTFRNVEHISALLRTNQGFGNTT
jgi:hypothetical protein